MGERGKFFTRRTGRNMLGLYRVEFCLAFGALAFHYGLLESGGLLGLRIGRERLFGYDKNSRAILPPYRCDLSSR